VEVEEN
jgi:hypothetical protein